MTHIAQDHPTDSISPALAESLGEVLGVDPDDYTDGVDSPQDEPVAEAPAGEVEAESAFSSELLNAAGLTEEEATASFGTPEALTSAVRMLDQRYLQAGQQLAAPVAPQPVQFQTQQPQQQTQQVTPPEEWEPFELPPPSDAEDWDADTKALVNALDQRHRSELAKRDALLQQQQQAMQLVLQDRMESQRKAYVDQFDGFVNELGDEYQSFLGKGTYRDMNPNSVFMRNRAHLDNTAAQYAAGRRAHGQPELSTKELLSRSLSLAFPSAGADVVRREVLDQVGQRQKLLTVRPTQRRSSKMTPEDRAVQNANNFLQSKGMPVVHDDFDYNTF
jgi:hypothetical protein